MIIPRFWAEARIQERSGDRQITVRRFGWSDADQEEAQSHAQSRAREAFDRAAAGGEILRREPRAAYNGADGVPIREEILSRHGNTVITRNGYGAQCLNTPDVFFADIDFAAAMPLRGCFVVTLLMVAGAAVLGWAKGSAQLAAGLGLLSLIAGPVLIWLLQKTTVRLQGGLESMAVKRVHRFAAAHPDWRIRLYRTPAGLRVLAVHRTFDPASEEVAATFAAMGTDDVYARMCLRQRCFRARVTPKPWRAGMSGRARIPGGIWPVNPEFEPQRADWVAEYDALSEGYAACRFLEEIGGAPAHPAALAVQDLHDSLCRAASGLPLA